MSLAPRWFGRITIFDYLDVLSQDTVMIGDRMDTDVVTGVESGMETILVLNDVTERTDDDRYPYHGSVAEIELIFCPSAFYCS